MKRLTLLLSILFLLSISVSAQVTRMVPERTTENPPTVCGPGRLYANITVAKLWLGASDNSCVEVVTGGGGAGANTALSNLASVAINTDLVFADDVAGDRGLTVTNQSVADTAGNGLNLTAGAGNGTGNGGASNLQSGAGGATGTGGNLSLSAGEGGGGTSGNGGTTEVKGGFSTSGNGGNVSVDAGDSDDGDGGSVSITSGSGTVTPGNINLTSTGNVAITAAAMTLNGSGVATLNPTTGALPYNDGTAFSDSPLTVTGSQVLVPDGTASAPVIARASNTGVGLFYSSNSLTVTAGGGATTQAFRVRDFIVSGGGVVGFSTTDLDAGATYDTAIGRSSAGVTEFNSGTLGTLRDWTARAGTLSSATVPITFSNAASQSCVALTTNASGVLGCTVSTAKAKQGFQFFRNGLDTIRRIQPQTFQYRADSPYADGGRTHLGLIAENLKAANPLLASATGAGVLQPEPMAISAALIDAVKTLDARITQLERDNKRLRRMLRNRR